MRAIVKLGKGKVEAGVLEKRPHSCLVRLPDSHIIVRKNWQIYGFIETGFWRRIVEFLKKMWYALRGKR